MPVLRAVLSQLQDEKGNVVNTVTQSLFDKRLAREKAAQAAAEREKAEKQQPKTAAEIFGVKLRSRPVPAVGVKVP